ncbi:MAG: citrate lyase holo-[acyl-carrier protein] synthase [Bacillota bacterium]
MSFVRSNRKVLSMDTQRDMLEKILEARELRSARQKELLDQYQLPLVSFTLNIPGPEKNSTLYEKIHEEGLQTLIHALKEKKIVIQHMEKGNRITGIEAFLCIDANPADIKAVAVNIEDVHPLGRLFDFDVFDQRSKLLSRSLFNKQRRKCLLCEEEAFLCARSKKHPVEALIHQIHKMAYAYFSDNIVSK